MTRLGLLLALLLLTFLVNAPTARADVPADPNGECDKANDGFPYADTQEPFWIAETSAAPGLRVWTCILRATTYTDPGDLDDPNDYDQADKDKELNALSYYVEYRKVGTAVWLRTDEQQWSESSPVITGLQPGTTYEYRLVVRSDLYPERGWHTDSLTVEFTTLAQAVDPRPGPDPEPTPEPTPPDPAPDPVAPTPPDPAPTPDLAPTPDPAPTPEVTPPVSEEPVPTDPVATTPEAAPVPPDGEPVVPGPGRPALPTAPNAPTGGVDTGGGGAAGALDRGVADSATANAGLPSLLHLALLVLFHLALGFFTLALLMLLLAQIPSPDLWNRPRKS